MAVTSYHSVNNRRQVLIPINEKMKKLVESRDDWRDDEGHVQDLVRLIVRPRNAHATLLHTSECSCVVDCLCHCDLPSEVDRLLSSSVSRTARIQLSKNKSSMSLTYCVYCLPGVYC